MDGSSNGRTHSQVTIRGIAKWKIVVNGQWSMGSNTLEIVRTDGLGRLRLTDHWPLATVPMDDFSNAPLNSQFAIHNVRRLSHRHGRAARLLRFGELLQQRLGLRERQAGVGDALPVDGGTARHVILPAFHEVALQHGAKHPP
jgi:hypothetical protein